MLPFSETGKFFLNITFLNILSLERRDFFQSISQFFEDTLLAL